MTQDAQSIPLEESAGASVKTGSRDGRPRMPEPLPVRLLCVDDAHLSAAAGLETKLDGFYIELLGFDREANQSHIIYRAENFRLFFSVVEIVTDRDDMRRLGIEVRSLGETEHKLIDAEHEYERQKGLTPGAETLLLQDPAGNWIELSESRRAG